MFHSCTSLKEPPELPATELTSSCYESMFKDCTSLVKTPSKLPADYLAVSCYERMFKNCVSLKEATALTALVTKKSCY